MRGSDAVYKQQFGAVAVEVIIIGLTLALLVFGFLEFYRYSIAKQMLRSAASYGLNLITTDYRTFIENDPEGGTSDYEGARLDAIAAVQAELTKLVGGDQRLSAWFNSGVDIDIIFPGDPGEPIGDRLRNDPVGVRLTTTFHDFGPLSPLSFFTVEMVETQEGYAERSFGSSEPVLVNCLGEPLSASSGKTTYGGDDIFGETLACPCQGDSLRWNYVMHYGYFNYPTPAGEGVCNCRPDLVEQDDGKCGCPIQGSEMVAMHPRPDNMFYYLYGFDCLCPACPNDEVGVPEDDGSGGMRCGCQCAYGASRDDHGKCECPGDQVVQTFPDPFPVGDPPVLQYIST
ncbi:MAG: pilus assembly protein, partial [Bdellovibrionales bacterium]|nr:pilus assembly protein [Bdellovibrionales bacterium]